MSKDNVKQMFGKMEKDAALKDKYARLMQAHRKDTEAKMAEKLIEFGKTSGFSFSKDDLLAARAEIIDKTNSNKELSDDDLSKVAGGITEKNMAVIISCVSLGIVCAGMSIDAEVSQQGSCGKLMTTTREC